MPLSPARGSELELSLTGTCITDSTVAAAACKVLLPEDFSDPLCALVFSTVRSLLAGGEKPDPIRVASAMQGTWAAHVAGGFNDLLKAVQEIASRAVDRQSGLSVLAAFESGARVARISRAARQLQEICSSRMPPEEALHRASKVIGTIARWSSRSPLALSIAEVVDQAIKLLEKKPSTLAITTGIAALDAALSGGIAPGELVLLAGRAKMGKSALAGHMVLSAVKAGNPAMVVTLEMPAWHWTVRWVAAITRIPCRHLFSDDLAPEELSAARTAMESLKLLPVTLIESRSASVADVQAAMHSMSGGGKPGLVVIDHIGLLSDVVSGRDPVKDLGDAAKRLRASAQEAGVGVLCISQLSREVERYPGRRPQLHHLRSSGELEQDADKVLLLYRDSYYYRPGTPIDRRTGEPARFPSDDTYVVLPDAAEVIVAANRNGPQATVPIRFNPETMVIGDWT